jgi:surface polysaccharide O-acyltransferase-like enzyme
VNKKRELYSDILKIIAIFLVVVIHVMALYRDKYFYTNGKYYALLTFVDSFTRIAVPIFFMITGTFMLSKTTEKYSDYFKKRIPKLLIPFFLISIFYYIYECNKVGASLSIKDFILAFLNGSIKYHLWYMYAIILIYLIIPFLQVLVQNLDRKKLLYLIIIIFILSNVFNTTYLLTNRYEYGMLKAFTLPNIFSHINCLFIGYYLHKYEISKNKRRVLGILSIICICMIPVADHFFVDGSRNDEMLVVTSIFPIIPAVFSYLFAKEYFKFKKETIFTKIIPIISSCTLYIYMIHVYIIEKFEKDLSKHWISDGLKQDILRIILVTIVSFIVSVLISYLIVTIQSLIKKLVLKKQEKK